MFFSAISSFFFFSHMHSHTKLGTITVLLSVLSTKALILCFEFKVIFILAPSGCALATCVHKDAFMYVCMCGREQGAFGGGLVR